MAKTVTKMRMLWVDPGQQTLTQFPLLCDGEKEKEGKKTHQLS